MDVLPRESGQSVLAAGHLIPAHHDEIKELTDCDRDHREIDAATAHHQGAQDRRGEPTGNRAD